MNEYGKMKVEAIKDALWRGRADVTNQCNKRRSGVECTECGGECPVTKAEQLIDEARVQVASIGKGETYEKAIRKAIEVFKYGRQFLKSDNILEKTAEHFKGEMYQSGGGVMVTLIKFADHFVVGVTDDCVCLYHNPKSEDIHKIFWNDGEQAAETWIY